MFQIYLGFWILNIVKKIRLWYIWDKYNWILGVDKLGKNYIDKTIQLMKMAFEKNKLQEAEQYRRLEKLQEKREKSN